MAAKTTSTTTRKAQAPLTREEKDALYANGTRADRDNLYRVNGALAARKAKGYGRAALAKALGIPEKTVWHAEFYLDKGTPELATWMGLIEALPAASKPSSSVGATATPAQAKKVLSENNPARKAKPTAKASASDVL